MAILLVYLMGLKDGAVACALRLYEFLRLSGERLFLKLSLELIPILVHIIATLALP